MDREFNFMNTLFNYIEYIQISEYTIQLWMEYANLLIHYSMMDTVFKFMNTLFNDE